MLSAWLPGQPFGYRHYGPLFARTASLRMLGLQKNWQLAGHLMDSWDLTSQLFARLAVAIFAAYVIYFFVFHKRIDFTIQVRHDGINYRGRVPLALQPAISQFLLQDLSLKEPVKIHGAWTNKRLSIWFRGRLGEGEKQRIRNFFAGRL